MKETIKLRVDFKEKIPHGTWPEDVRRVVMGIVDDQNPAYSVINNRESIYPRLHYCIPGPYSFFFQGIGERGKNAIMALMQAFASATVVLGSQRLTLNNMDMQMDNVDVRETKNLHVYKVVTPLLMWEKHELFVKRTENIQHDYEQALQNHFGWISRQFGGPDTVSPVIVQDLEEQRKSLKKNMKMYPAMSKGRIIARMELPPAIGHGTGLGWGRIKKLNLNETFGG